MADCQMLGEILSISLTILYETPISSIFSLQIIHYFSIEVLFRS